MRTYASAALPCRTPVHADVRGVHSTSRTAHHAQPAQQPPRPDGACVLPVFHGSGAACTQRGVSMGEVDSASTECGHLTSECRLTWYEAMNAHAAAQRVRNGHR